MTGLGEILQQNQLLRDMLAKEREEVAVRTAAIEQRATVSEQRAAALEVENARLLAQKALDDKKIALLMAAADAAQRELERIRLREQSARSERFVDPGHPLLPFPGEASDPPRDRALVAVDDPEPKAKPPPARRRNLGKAPQPRQRERLAVPEGATCAKCKGALKQVGEAVSERIDWVPGQFIVREITREKCACPSCPELGVLAPSLPYLLPGALCGNGLLARVAVDKFADHIPLNRQSDRMAREGLDIDSKVLSSWMASGAARLKPLVRAICAEVLACKVLQGDDTGLPVQDGANGKLRKGRLWVFTDREQALYAFTDSKAAVHPQALLADFAGHTLLVDGGSEFNGVVEKLSLDRAGCWSHARRYFMEARQDAPDHAALALGTIRDLFLIEREVAGAWVDVRAAVRLDRSKVLVEGLLTWAEKLVVTTRPTSPLGAALGYLVNQRAPLTTFLDEPSLPIHNNLSELLLRSPVVGRKNWLFAGSEGGAQAAVAWFTLIGSCRLQGVDPFAYLVDVMERLDDHPTSRLGELTPRGWRAAREIGA